MELVLDVAKGFTVPFPSPPALLVANGLIVPFEGVDALGIDPAKGFRLGDC